MNDQKKDVQKQEAPKTIEGAQGGNTSSWKRLLGKKVGVSSNVHGSSGNHLNVNVGVPGCGHV